MALKVAVSPIILLVVVLLVLLFVFVVACGFGGCFSETGRIRFRGVRFQTPNSVSFSGLTEFRGASSVSSSQPIICV